MMKYMVVAMVKKKTQKRVIVKRQKNLSLKRKTEEMTNKVVQASARRNFEHSVTSVWASIV